MEKENVTIALREAQAATGVIIHESAEIPVSAIVFCADLLKACESNVCGKYNTSWTCPPKCAGIREKILLHQTALVFTSKHGLEDSFDYEAMTEARELHVKLTLDMRNRLGDNFLILGAGSCPVCRKCAFPEPCIFPEKQIGSIEAAGINVTELSKAAGLTYNNGPNTVTYISIILL